MDIVPSPEKPDEPSRAITPNTLPYPPWAERFLAAFSQMPNVRAACKMAGEPGQPGISRMTYYRYYRGNAEFRAAVDAAKEDGVDRIEQELFNLALTQKSFKAMQFLLRAHRPHVYNFARRTEADVNVQGEINYGGFRARIRERLRPRDDKDEAEGTFREVVDPDLDPADDDWDEDDDLDEDDE